jgi:uncharacterized membrane protein
MLKITDRAFAVLLLLFAAGHVIGSVQAYAFLTPELVWAISATAFAALLAVLNFVRAGRPEDRTLAWICFGGCVAWIVLALSFGISVGNIFDVRADLHALAAFVLAVFSFITASPRADQSSLAAA